MRIRRAGAPEDEPRVVDVEILEDDGPAHDADEALTGRGRRRSALRWVVAAAAVIAVVVVANVVEMRRDAARLAALAQIPGVVAPLTEPLTELWRAPGDWVTADVGEVLLVSDDGSATVRGVHAESGEVLWTRQNSRDEVVLQCFAAGADGAATQAQEELLLCARLVLAPAGDRGIGAGSVVVETVDPMTGRPSASLGPFAGDLLITDLHDGDVIIGLVDVDDMLRVVRWDPDADSEVWSYGGDGTGVDLAAMRSLALEDGVLAVRAQESVGIDLTTGQEVPLSEAEEAAPWTQSFELPDGGRVVWTPYFSNTGAGDQGSGHVEGPDGEVRYELEDPPAIATITDGSVPDVLMTASDAGAALRGLDVTTGRERWSVDLRSASPRVQVDGIAVVLTDYGRAVGLDVRTGRVLWEVTGLHQGGSTVTDGEVVLLVRPDDDAGSAVVAHAVDDGAEVWRTHVDAAVHHLDVLGGDQLVAMTDQDLVGLG